MFLEVSATLGDVKITEQGRRQAAAEFRKRAAGRSAVTIADLAGISDPSTVRTFMDGDSWPRSGTRRRLEGAVGMWDGELEAIARGDVDPDAPSEDPVVAAIERSALNRANRHKLIGTYYDMLDAQGEVGSA